MYHYVRESNSSQFPDIKGLEVTQFKEQLNYLLKNYTIVRVEDVIEALDLKKKLPTKAALLTFDDGYIDHYTNVFPLLKHHGIQGAFYPSAQAVKEQKVLDVNKIHFILACTTDKNVLVKDIFAQLDKHRAQYKLLGNSQYFEKLAKTCRFDTADVVFIKRILQVELDTELRNLIVDTLFEKYVGLDETSFSKTLYMNFDQLKEMHDAGMHIGVHGYHHEFLGSLTQESQQFEIEKSLDFHKELSVDNKMLTICYPYGDFNSSLLKILHNLNFRLGMTTGFKIADLSKDNYLTLPRVDTNDLPYQTST